MPTIVPSTSIRSGSALGLDPVRVEMRIRAFPAVELVQVVAQKPLESVAIVEVCVTHRHGHGLETTRVEGCDRAAVVDTRADGYGSRASRGADPVRELEEVFSLVTRRDRRGVVSLSASPSVHGAADDDPGLAGRQLVMDADSLVGRGTYPVGARADRRARPERRRARRGGRRATGRISSRATTTTGSPDRTLCRAESARFRKALRNVSIWQRRSLASNAAAGLPARTATRRPVTASPG